MRLGKSIFDLPLRVTFYARVSTDKNEQRGSLENQIQYYTELIKGNSNWIFIPGYIDEGISGTSTKRRDSFNRMIADAKAGCFDFIITKEISRFSRSTLDSIKYTQELLEHNVGVLFQNDNINTLDSDSEFRLVVMAGVAQDEVRKLSERLKFGFRQAVKNGHVLGGDGLWGYDKKNCVMTVNEKEAEIIRIIFDLYANRGFGVRRISHTLLEMGYTSREGNAFNVLTIRHILTNPKYKGWYCGNKSQTVDYRTKRKIFLEENDWVTYPDTSIPAIVTEELWDRANLIYKERSGKMKQRQAGSGWHNRYAYSSKIFCEEHEAVFYRQVLRSDAKEREAWQCRVYRQGGRKACAAPQIFTEDLNRVMSLILKAIIKDKRVLIDFLVEIIRSAPKKSDRENSILRLEAELGRIKAKKERILELSVQKALPVDEFKERNDALNGQARDIEERLCAARSKNGANAGITMEQIAAALESELSFEGGISSALASSIVERIVVKRESTKYDIHLEISLKTGQSLEAAYTPQKSSLKSSISRNITLRPMSRRT